MENKDQISSASADEQEMETQAETTAETNPENETQVTENKEGEMTAVAEQLHEIQEQANSNDEETLPVSDEITAENQVSPSDLEELYEENVSAPLTDKIVVNHEEATTESEGPFPAAEEHHEEIEHEPLENFSEYNKEQLTAKMETFANDTDLNTIKNKVNLARDAFNHILSTERAAALSKFLEDGGAAEDFHHHADELEERFNKAYSKYGKHRSEFILGQEKLRKENLKTKQEILQHMKNIIQNEEDMSKAFNEFHDLQAKWRNTGPVPPQNVNDLWMTYKLYIERFYDYIKINRELQDLDQKKNLEMKLQLCERAEELLLEQSLNKAINEAQQLQIKWKEIGIVPREKRTEIWTRFKSAVDKIYDNKKHFLEGLREKHNANLEAKTKLAEQAEAILNATYERHAQWQEGLKNILELQTEWRKAGPADKAQNDAIWKRFKTAVDGFFKLKDDFYKKKKQEYAANLQQKTELCMQAEGLVENSDWKTTASELIRLQQEWKKIGQVGSNDKNDKIWARFKAACDAFFNRKSEHFAEQDKANEENYIKKLELVERVEKFEKTDNAAESIDQLKAFQREWNDIGLVPMKKKDIIWDKFRKAIQVHFDALKVRPDFRQGFSTRNEQSGSRPASQRAHHPHEANASPDERGIVVKMNKLKEEVDLLENNIGFFAKSKSAAAMKLEYEQKIQAAKDEIAKLKEKLKEIKKVS